jgi:hypothetical protein
VTEKVGAADSRAKKSATWLVLLAALIAGAVLLADGLSYAPAQKLTAKLGIALLFSAIALFIGNGRAAGYVATVILWAAVVATILL